MIWQDTTVRILPAACTKAREWDYNRDAPIALGAFFQKTAPVFEAKTAARKMSAAEREQAIRDLLKKRT